MAEYTKRQQAYLEAVERNLYGCEGVSTGPCPGCPQCASYAGMGEEEHREAWEAGKIESEPYFSWSPCDVCGSPLGGDREDLHYVSEGEIYHGGEVCVDCMIYLANGDVPDDENLDWIG